jgi:site-specific recombinase XerD
MPIRQDTLRERWLAEQRYAETTKRTYRETLADFQRRHPVHAERVRLEHLIDYLTTDANGHETRRAPSTLERQRATLRVFWRWAKRRGYVKMNPAEDLDCLNVGRGERRPGRWLTRADARTLLDACDDGTDQGMRDHALIITALLTGLRRAELAGLTWRCLDLAQRRVDVKGKGSKLATIGLPDQAADVLAAWGQVVAAHRGRRPRPDDPVFPSGRPTGGLHNSEQVYVFHWRQPLSVWTVRAIIARRASAAGLGTVGTHDLRRSFAGFLDADGVDLKGIQAALRHSSPDVTVRCYLDRSPRRAMDATACLTL